MPRRGIMPRMNIWYDTWTAAPPVPGVYAVRDPRTGLVKVGKANNQQKRFASMSTGTVLPLQFVGTLCCDPSLEQRFHARWNDARVRGEWFYPVADLCDLVSYVLTRGPLRDVRELICRPVIEPTEFELEQVSLWRVEAKPAPRDLFVQGGFPGPARRGRGRPRNSVETKAS